jgi:hypothetical protein
MRTETIKIGDLDVKIAGLAWEPYKAFIERCKTPLTMQQDVDAQVEVIEQGIARAGSPAVNVAGLLDIAEIADLFRRTWALSVPPVEAKEPAGDPLASTK